MVPSVWVSAAEAWFSSWASALAAPPLAASSRAIEAMVCITGRSGRTAAAFPVEFGMKRDEDMKGLRDR